MEAISEHPDTILCLVAGKSFWVFKGKALIYLNVSTRVVAHATVHVWRRGHLPWDCFLLSP